MKWWLILQCTVLKLTGLGLFLWADQLLVGSLVFLSGGGVIMVHLLLPRTQGFCDVVTGFRPKGKEVWLTIDDGPDREDTPLILEALAAYGMQATFFMIGERAAAHPEWVGRVLAAGHSIGTHTQTHPLAFFWAFGRARVRRELDESLEVLRREGATIQLYRSPVGIKNFFLRRVLRERNLDCVAWTVRSGDALSPSVPPIVRRVERELRPGAILLMHEGRSMNASVRVAAIRAVLALLHAEGYRCILPQRERFLKGKSTNSCA